MANRDYGFFSRMLHRAVLGTKFISETSFDIEKLLFFKSDAPQDDSKHVFITGLARAGTTFLMNQLYQSGSFISLTYKDMPFVLAPNCWRLITGLSKKKYEMKERAHRDGVLVSSESPEALEEVFWSLFCGPDYIKSDRLIPMQAAEETIDHYRAYVSLILNGNENKRYISKNNNHVLRLGSISQAFPNAALLIPFRDPVQQAYSLMMQHKNFLKTHQKDYFAKTYMTWLVHHEFGEDHRPFVFSGQNTNQYNTDDINYWLQIWLDTYTFILHEIPSNGILVCYEKLCNTEDDVWEKLFRIVDVSDAILPNELWSKKPYNIPTDMLSPPLYRKVADLYNGMLENAL